MQALPPIEIDVDDEIKIRRRDRIDPAELHRLVIDNLEHLSRFMPWARPEYSIEDARKFAADSVQPGRLNTAMGGGIYCAGKLVGDIELRVFLLSRIGQIGYWLDRNHEGRGIVTRCCRRLLELGFEAHGLHRIEIKAATQNTRSRNIALRLGMRHEGTQREAAPAPGGYDDLEVYSILEQEWSGRRGA